MAENTEMVDINNSALSAMNVISIAPIKSHSSTPEPDNVSYIAESQNVDEIPIDFSVKRSRVEGATTSQAEPSDAYQPTDLSRRTLLFKRELVSPVTVSEDSQSPLPLVAKKLIGQAESKSKLHTHSQEGDTNKANAATKVGEPKVALPQTLPETYLNLMNGTVLTGLQALIPPGAAVLSSPGAVLSTLTFPLQAQLQPQILSQQLLQSQLQQQIVVQQLTNGGKGNIDISKNGTKTQKLGVKTANAKSKSGSSGETSRVYPAIMPLPSDMPDVDAMNSNSQEAFKKFKELVMKSREAARLRSRNDSHSESASPESRASMSPTASLSDSTSGLQSSFSGGTISATVTSTSNSRTLKRLSSGGSGGGQTMREKDDAYWERRRRNNDAAKRSRDARRQKEDEIAVRAAFLEQENVRLRIEVASLRTETTKLRALLYGNNSNGDDQENV